MGFTHVFAGIPTADLAPALAWYERFLGRPPDGRPHDREAVWQVSSDGLIYVVSDPERAGQALVTLIVDDLDERLARLADEGIASGSIESLPGARKATFTDPDGNSISLGQVVAA